MADIKAVKVDGTKYPIKIPSENVKSMTGYSKGSSTDAILTSDTLNSAIGKLECRADKNQTNILSVTRKVGNNILAPTRYLSSANGITVTVEANGIQIAGKASGNPYVYVKIGTITVVAGEKYALIDTAYNADNYLYVDSSTAFGVSAPSLKATVTYLTCAVSGTYNIYLRATYNVTVNTLHAPLICLKSLYDADPVYSPYGAPNSDLTRTVFYAINTGVKNWFAVTDGTYSSNSASNSSVCLVENGAVKIITCTTGETRTMTLGTITIPAGTYMYTNCFFGSSAAAQLGDVRLLKPDGSRLSPDAGGVFTVTEETIATVRVYTWSTSVLNQSVTPFLCAKTVYDQSPSYCPGGRPNYDLTRLEAEDRAALAEEIDAGAKNKLKYDMAQLAALNPTWTVSGSTIRPSSDTHITFTLNSDMSIRVQSDGSNAQAELCLCTSNYSSLKAGTYVLSGCPTGGNSSTTYDLRLIEQSSPKKYNVDVGSAKEIPWSAQYSYTCNIMVRANQNIDITFKPMVCTLADWKVSRKFVSYIPSYQDLVNATNIEVLTSSDIFTPNTNYTVINDGAIYKQGKHIFGNLIISKSDGDFNAVETTIGQIKTGYRPAKLYIGNDTTFNTSQWGVNGIGYCYIPAINASMPNVIVKTSTSDTNKFSIVIIRLDYCTP